MAMVYRTVSIFSLQSMSEDFVTSTRRFNVTEGFKRNWFQNTLNFVKDEQKQTLNYGVTPSQAVFIRNMLNFEDDPSIQKGVYTPLYEALKIFGLRYTFKLSWIKSDLLELRKIRKTSDRYQSQLEPDASTYSTKNRAKSIREMSVVEKLSQNYMVDIAKTIVDFMQDPTRATLEFKHVKPLESLFMQTVLNASRPMFPEHASMMQFVNRMKPTMDYNLQVVIGKVNKNTNLRTVTFKKHPKFQHESRRHKVRSSSTNRLDSRKAKLLEDMSMPVQLDKPARMMQRMGWNGGPLGCRGVGITEPIIPTLDLVNGAGLGHARKTVPVTVSQPDLISKPDIPSLPTLSKPDLPLQENIPNSNVPDVISQPERFPKPDLSKPAIVPKSYSFKMGMLRAVLDLIESERRTFELVYSNKIKKKDIKFVRNVVISLAEYKKLGLCDADEVVVSRKIIEMLKKFPNVVIFATVSDCNRKVTLRKELKQSEKRALQQTVNITLDDLQTIGETMGLHNDFYKEKIYIGYRVAVLCEILHMYKTKTQCKELFFDKFVKRHITFIKDAVTAVNLRNIPKSSKKRDLERGICSEIVNRIGDTILLVNFEKSVNKSAHFQILTHNNSFASTIQTKNSSDIVFRNNEYACTKHNSRRTIDLIRINNNSNINNVRGVTYNNTQVLNATKDKNASTNKKTKTCEIVTKSNTVTIHTNYTENNNINNEQKKHGEIDDDVMIIEKEVETIDISDDESINPTSQSTQNIVEEMSVTSSNERQDLEIKITSVEGNVMFDENISQENVELLENQSDELDLSKSLNSLDIGYMTNGDCFNAIATSEGYLRKCKDEEFNNTEGNQLLTALVNSSDSSVTLDKEICVGTAVKPEPGVEISKTDIADNSDGIKIIPKKEKLSYSDEFDTDLYNLAQVLDLDEDIFDYRCIKTEATDKSGTSMSKRSRSDSEQSSPDNSKKTKVFTFEKFKNLLIVPKDYPEVNLKRENIVEIQMILSEAIENCRELPLLQCHGIQDGGLFYSCHDEQSVFFVQNSLSVTSNYKIVNDVIIKKKPHKMKIKVNLLLDDAKKLLNRLELYNAGLITDSWHVKDVLKSEDYILMTVELDQHSFKYICDNSFCLYAGIDKAQFTIVWD